MDDCFREHPLRIFHQGDCSFVKEAYLWAQKAGLEIQQLHSLEWFQENVPADSAGIALLGTQQVDQPVRKLLHQLRLSYQRIIPIVLFGEDEIELLCSLSLEHQFISGCGSTRGPAVWETLAFAREKVEDTVRNLERDLDFRTALDGLTEEERKLLKLWMGGWQNKQIASELDVCLRTAQMRKQGVLRKLGEDNVNVVIARIAHLRIPEFLDSKLFGK